jgi:hypothetical protein
VIVILLVIVIVRCSGVGVALLRRLLRGLVILPVIVCCSGVGVAPNTGSFRGSRS